MGGPTSVSYASDVYQGVDTALTDWRFVDPDFTHEYSEFESWAEVMKDSTWWNLIEFIESEPDHVPWNKLWTKHYQV